MVGPLSQAEVEGLYSKYAYLLLRRLRTLLRDDALAQDVLHDGFIKVIQAGDAFREVRTPLHWLYRLFDNLAIDRIRTRRFRGPHEEFSNVHEADIGPAPSAKVEEREVVARLLAELDDTDRRVLILTFVDGLTQEETARELGLSRGTINKRVQALRVEVARILGGALP